MAGNLIGANEPGHDIGARRQIEARRNHDVYDHLPQITNPVFVCGGRYDGIALIANQKALVEKLPNAQMELFEGGHGFRREDPESLRAHHRLPARRTGRVELILTVERQHRDSIVTTCHYIPPIIQE
jgi:pimeloyl-ACP methyl ester carboxylesterase